MIGGAIQFNPVVEHPTAAESDLGGQQGADVTLEQGLPHIEVSRGPAGPDKTGQAGRGLVFIGFHRTSRWLAAGEGASCVAAPG